ncbi:Cytidylate kinase [Desulfurella amilsii]|uniref:Cytidylate kinase n=1 Tax=Desulfurella amilsii TaxID=1562698 RepID=A0A1X4XVK5_9BACT|nr:(d)CMP kinase [Desulfurella amilsii]OSS41576.1 Cytidylate kinase [Desulfurella amilsii]
MANFIVTIDGPSGSGKSTICKMLAKNDGFIHIDTGKIYRSIAYLLGETFSQDKLNKLKLDFKLQDSQILLVANGKILNDLLSSEYIAKKASLIAQKEFVRSFVNDFARKIAYNGKFVIDGRDAGSLIFTNAQLKFFLTAKTEERAKRRSIELSINYKESLDSIIQRDKQDSERKVSPLVVPKGAIKIDSSNLAIEEVYSLIKSYL